MAGYAQADIRTDADEFTSNYYGTYAEWASGIEETERRFDDYYYAVEAELLCQLSRRNAH